MTLVVAVLTAAIALLCGGRIRDLERLNIRSVWIFPLAVVLMVLLNYSKYYGWLPESLTPFIQPSIYLLIIAGIVLNRHIPGTLVLAAGTFMNFLVIAANGGYMPVSPVALEASGLTNKELATLMDLRHSMMDASTNLAFLGDIIPIPWPPLFRSVGSIGDLVVAAGMILIVWRLFFPSADVKPSPAPASR